tara:strand:- start:1651 stop:2628 length:978 start_codon:yes stop_codon:yes gene_type:complete
MAFANSSVTDIIATTIQNRSKTIADNVLKNNALLAKLNMRGNVRTISGGNTILEELSFAQNGNAGFYSGYDLLPVAAQDVISAAEFNIKQLACPVVISGLEMLQNSGKEAFIDLLEARLNVAESTMMNKLAQSVYSDGTGSSGKEVTGLNAAVPSDPTTGTYGGIDRATWTFWRSQLYDFSDQTIVASATTIGAAMNKLWSSTTRGSDRADLIVLDTNYWTFYVTSLQAQQRFTSPEVGNLGFPSIKFMDSDVVLDGGIGGYCPANTGFFLNTKYMKWRPHADRNMVPLSPNRRYAINQDAEVQILAWAGNLTCSGAQFQGRMQA